jgi:hypothetical protein
MPRADDAERRKRAAERRQKRAEAAGFSSYGQQYRAAQRGYEGQGAPYNAALDVAHHRKTAPVVKRRTARGVVLSAEAGHMRALMSQIRREMGG